MSDTPSQELSVALTNSNYHSMKYGVHRTLTKKGVKSQNQIYLQRQLLGKVMLKFYTIQGVEIMVHPMYT
jgi:hypothetical protein